MRTVRFLPNGKFCGRGRPGGEAPLLRNGGSVGTTLVCAAGTNLRHRDRPLHKLAAQTNLKVIFLTPIDKSYT